MNSNSEAGITLVELLVASAVAMAITGFLGTAIFQFFTVTRQGSEVMTSVHQVQNAQHWLQLDGQMAVTASGSAGGVILTLPDDSTISYDLSDARLVRTADGAQLTVARNVSELDFSVDERVVTMSIASSPPGGSAVSEQGTCKVYMRPSEAE